MRPAAERNAFDSHFALDASQAAAVEVLTTSAENGVYLWGPVGRGKTWLLDRYYAGVRLPGKRRVHFHSFFRDLHASYFRHGFSLERALDDMLGDILLLCFDEFHVHDIGDARLIARMLDVLFDRGITLVATSNYPPDGLLPNPLFHDAFVPTIEVLKSTLAVVEVAGPTDYRTSGASMSRFATGSWSVDGSHDRAQDAGHDIPELRFTELRFTELCDAPKSTADYLSMTEGIDTLTIIGIPALKNTNRNAVQRFCNLVDVLYDRDIRTDFHAAVPLENLADDSSDGDCRGHAGDGGDHGRNSLDINRILSRLAELGTGAGNLQK